MAKRHASGRRGGVVSEAVNVDVVGFERHRQPFGRKIQMSPAMTNIIAMAPIMPIAAA